MNKEIDERGERWGKVKLLKEKRDIQKVCGKIWQKARTSCIISYFTLLIISVIGIIVALVLTLEQPLPINYGMSWVILTLISMITLTYVQLINRLKDSLISDQEEKTRIKASRMICMLVVTSLVLFITILALVARIALLSFDPGLAKQVYQISVGNETIGNWLATYSCSPTLLIWSDYIMVSSLIVGSIMRVCIFLKSYVLDKGDLLHHTINYESFMKKQYKILEKDEWFSLEELRDEKKKKKKEEESKVMQKAFRLSKVAKEQFDSLPKKAKNRVKEVLYYLDEPEKKQMLDIKKLKGVDGGKDLFRLRIKDYNVVYFEDVNGFRIIQFRGKEYEWP